MVSSGGASEKKQRRCFCLLCCLPAELLALILGRLSILDFISFRAVCKCWRSALDSCPVVALENQAHKQLPWFLILRAENPSESESFYSHYPRPLLYTTGKFGELSSRHIYSIDIPELCGTQILLSKHGWLLLYSSSDTLQSLFLFNPFSRARVELPLMRVSELVRPVFDISGPPTSPNCTAFVISWANCAFEVSLCKRGESTWTTKIYYEGGILKSPVDNVVFTNGVWYCLHQAGNISTFELASRSLKDLGWPKITRSTYQRSMVCHGDAKSVSYVIKRGDEFFLCIHNMRWHEISLKDPLKVVQSYFDGSSKGLEKLLRSDVEKAILQFQNGLAIDSFNADAWCAECDSDNVISFRWHSFSSFVGKFLGLEHNGCHRDGNCPTMIIWIEPTWIHSYPNLSWNL